MPTNYEQALRGQANLANVNFNDMPPQELPGREFVWSCRRQMVTPLNHMNQINTRFHQFLVNRGWVW